MKRYFWSALTACSLLLASCSPLALPDPTATPLPPTETPAPAPTEPTEMDMNSLPPAVSAAQEFLAKALGLADKAQLAVKNVEKVEWPDGCLGLGGPDEACMMMIVPGYRVVLTDNKSDYEVRTDESGENIRQATYATGLYPPAVAAAQEFLSKALGLVDASTLTIKSVEAVEWADGCLELGGPAEACMMMIVPGYRVVFTDGKHDYELHTDEAGTNIRQAPPTEVAPTPVLIFQRTGGIAGVCQRLTVDTKGYYTLVSCGEKEVLLGAGQLPAAGWEKVQQWQSQYAAFTWETPVQPGSADMFMDSITFTGMGTESATAETEKLVIESFDAWWQNLPRTAPDFTDSGVTGMVLISPACPGPQTADPACADKPYPLHFTVTDDKTEAVLAEVHVGEDGLFRMALPPGAYTLNPILTGHFPVGSPTAVTVEAGKFVEVTIMLDSGMR